MVIASLKHAKNGALKLIWVMDFVKR
jgi:hypothetical protein